MDWTHLPELIAWARKNAALALGIFALLAFLYVGYEFIGGYANALGISFVTEYSKFKKSVASYTVIDTMLQHYQTQFNASRIGIARFHDNVRDVANNSMFFVSFESILSAPGITVNVDEVKNVPANAFSSILPKLIDQKPILIRTNDMPNGQLKELLHKRGDVATLFIPVQDLNDRLIGLLALSWVYDGQIPDITTEQMNELKIAADRIGAYFSAAE